MQFLRTQKRLYFKESQLIRIFILMNQRILLFILVFAGLNSLWAQEIPEINSQYQFVENKGQWPEQVNFRADVPGGFIWLEEDKFNYQFLQYPHIHGHSLEEIKDHDLKVKQHVIWAEFVDCNEQPTIQKNQKSTDYYNFLLGNNKKKWASYCYAYSDITYENFYPGIDMRIYEKNLDLKYDFTLQPNAKNSIQIKYSGQDKIRINKKGNLIIETSLGQVIEEKPYAYQIKNGKLIEIECEFKLNKDIVTFALGDYDQNYKLTIDPVLIFASYSGSFSDNFGMTATYDDQGDMFSGGMAFGNGYPTTPGAFDEDGTLTNLNAQANAAPAYGCTDVVITKYNSTGTSRLYSTYIGGGTDLGGTETVHSLIADSTGNLYFFGTTSSTDFPTTAGCYDDSHNGGNFVGFVENGVYYYQPQGGFFGGVDIYVAILDPAGANLVGSTYIGGSGNDGINYNLNSNATGNYYSSYDSLQFNYGDQFRGEIMLDDSLNVYVASCSRSSDFPMRNAYQGTPGGGDYDGIVFKFDSLLTDLKFSTYLGGISKDACYSVKIINDTSIVVAGGTCSNNFPTTPGAYQGAYQGGIADAFISILSKDGQTLRHSTFFGTTDYEQNYFVEVDRWGKVFTVGQSRGTVPVSPGTYSNPNSKQFLTKFSEDLSTMEISTVFGNGNGLINISPAAFLVDFCGNTYVSGWGAGLSAGSQMQQTNLTGMPITFDAFQPSSGDGRNFYLIVLGRDFESLLYGSYIGSGSSREHVDGGTSRFDKNGIVYQSVCGGCTNDSGFPTTPGAVSNTNNSSNCNNLVFKFDFEIVPKAEFTPDVTEGCAPFTVQFMNTSSDSTNYLWDFGDGDTTSQDFNPVKVYDTPGVYQVKLLVTDTICLLVDTAEVTITVYDSLLITTMNDTVICGPATFDIWASSYGTSVEYQWSSTNQFLDTLNANLADSVLTINPGNPQYYYVRITNPWCTEIDSVYIDFIGDVLVINPDTNICLGDVINLQVVNTNPSVTFTYDWQPASEIISGQGTPTVTVSPSSTTTFTINAVSSNGCVISEDIEVGVYFIDPASVDATAQLDTIYQGGSTFLYASPDSAGYTYQWVPPNTLDNPLLQSPLATPTQDTWYLVIIRKGGCVDTAQVKVTVLENICDDPTVFIPNAFTPNDDGINDEVLVRGDNIELMTFRIFDRWGEMVFETEDQTVGWDGTFKGKLLNPDVYVYYLDVTCVGGDEQLIKGNITIIR